MVSLPPIAVTYPITATWEGAFYTPAGGPVRLTLPGVPAARLWLLGQPAAFASPFVVDAGWTPFRIEAALAGPPALDLRLQVGTAPAAPLETGRLWPEP